MMRYQIEVHNRDIERRIALNIKKIHLFETQVQNALCVIEYLKRESSELESMKK